jgi:hypothetical protein
LVGSFLSFLNEKGEEEAFLSQLVSRWKKKIIAAAKFELVQKESIRPLRVEEF